MSDLSHAGRNTLERVVDEHGRVFEWQQERDGGLHFIVTACPCGCRLEGLVVSLSRSVTVHATLLCKLSIEQRLGFEAPKTLVEHARQAACDDLSRAAAIRAAAGGSGLHIPDC